jgi:uncharacterized protein (TIGR01777 family)
MEVEAATTIVLSGASGMLGTALRQALSARNAAVLQLVRRMPGPGQVMWTPAATPIIEDPSLLEGCRAAVHLSGASLASRRWSAAYKHELAASRVNSTHVLATALAGLQRPPRVLLVASAVGFYGDRGEEVLDESSAAGSGFLPGLCREWEAAARPAVEAGIHVVNLRFGVILGRGSGALARMLPVFRMGLGGRLGNGRQWMSWVSLEDAVAAIILALDTEKLAGPVNVTAPNPVTNAEFTRALARQLRLPAIIPAPAIALKLAFGQMAQEALLASTRAVPPKLLGAGFQFRHPTIEQALVAALS